MDKQSRNRLPEQCLFMNANGEIMRIEYGKSGFSRSELNTENRKANQVIVNSYNERHGITAEQINTMHQGALFGWDVLQLSRQEQSGMKSGRIFEVEISRPGSFGVETSSTLTLPAAQYEILDALDKARITDERVIYSAEIMGCELDYLPQFIGTNANLYELNHLAERLSSLNEWELDCFEGMVMMDTIQTQYSPIAVDRLINMTHSMNDCHVVYKAHDDSTLGKFYADNDFVQKLENVPDEIYECLDFSKIGKEMREGEGGVFTPHGYVVQNGEILQTYHSGYAVPLEKPDYTVLLRVTKGYFNDPQYDNDLIAFLKLPADDEMLSQAVEAVKAASAEECVFSTADCMIPSLTEKIGDALYESEGDSYGLVNELAQQLRHLKEENGVLTYKAMLETAPADISLEDALDLTFLTEEFEILSETASPADYAEKEVQRMMSFESDDGLEQFCNLEGYGRYLMEKYGIAETPYGLLEQQNGRTVEQCLNRPSQNHGMEMK
ncbi:antirestriction protein ArdA [Lacrimispora sp.]|uniref:antirestriction protein ArdA n=1 Tax=Lacrimispora sp. TaxID=2719234 RepID=UPI0034610867